MQFDSTNKARGTKRLFLAYKNSGRALYWLAKNEAAFKQEVVLLLFSLIVVCIWDIGIYEKLILVWSVVFILFTEIINTAIEAVVDRISLDIHPLSGLAKDLGSAAVLLAIALCAIVWITVIIHHLLLV
ncbi:diacylglycerol kinase [Alteromonas sp. C1M14]|uniref:diacylglycerol kinase n=1 Tax=Alteromonas sp. C1M14 TaxID=2841567 RepID=UPI001C0A4ABE|nr:diacylglycerol kinase [Alteromonas sp. C1M14]MBU2978193.1 diacylglycerol kinase [Alteromonas sp. C1M14]